MTGALLIPSVAIKQSVIVSLFFSEDLMASYWRLISGNEKRLNLPFLGVIFLQFELFGRKPVFIGWQLLLYCLVFLSFIMVSV